MVIYEQACDLRLEWDGWVLPAAKDSNSSEMFSVGMSPFIYCRRSQQPLLCPINNSNNKKHPIKIKLWNLNYLYDFICWMRFVPLSLASFSCPKTIRSCNNLQGLWGLWTFAGWAQSQGRRLRALVKFIKRLSARRPGERVGSHASILHSRNSIWPLPYAEFRISC